jgi:hypothetical protein
MVFMRPNPFPKSILVNVVYGLRINGLAAGHRSEKQSAPRRVFGPMLKNNCRGDLRSPPGQKWLCVRSRHVGFSDVLPSNAPVGKEDDWSLQAFCRLLVWRVPVRKDYWFSAAISVKGKLESGPRKSDGEDDMLTDLLLVLFGVSLIPLIAALLFFLVCLVLGTLQILFGAVARLVRVGCHPV